MASVVANFFSWVVDFLEAYVNFLETYNGAVTAFATVLIGIFTWVLAHVTNRQARLTREAIELANKEYISTHRPRIVLRDIHLIGEDVLYMLVNAGDTPATVIESWIFAEFVEDRTPLKPLRSAGHDDLGRLTFAAGEAKDLTYRLPDEVGFTIKWPEATKIGIEGRPPRLGKSYFVGVLIYADDLGVRRRSIFRRHWDDDSLSFVRLNSDQERDHEYAD
jgi:hypothetical protein